MIEVEKKFNLRDEDRIRLVEGAVLKGEYELVDAYFDDKEYSLSCSDRWLRERNGSFDLKLPIAGMGRTKERSVNIYKEVTGDELYAALGMKKGFGMAEDLAAHGYLPYAHIRATRQKYEKSGFGIDLDVTDFGYVVGEIELMVEGSDEVEQAEKTIYAFAESQGISLSPVGGKLMHYLKERKPEVYALLVESGVVTREEA